MSETETQETDFPLHCERLRWRIARGKDVMPTGPMVPLAGAVALGMGGLAIWLPYNDIGNMPASPEPVMLIGGIFVAVGLFIIARWSWTLLGQRMGDSDEPAWRGDYNWQREGEKDHQLRWIIYASSLAAALGAFGGLLYWLTQRGMDGMMIRIIMLVCFAGAVAAAGFAGWLMFKLVLFGRTRVQVDAMPAQPGETLTARWFAPSLDQCQSLVFTLRYIQERIVFEGTGEHSKQKWYVEERWSNQYTVDSPQQIIEGQAISVTFDIPRDARSTRLDAREPRYWELEVTARRAGLNFTGRYLVPIYNEDGSPPSRLERI
jgi:hypothetical protein